MLQQLPRTLFSGVLVEGAGTGAFRVCLEVFVARAQDIEHIARVLREENLVISKERVESVPPVRNDRSAARCRLEKSSRGTITRACHPAASDVQRRAR